MIFLNTGQTNKVALSLSESTTITGTTYYIFKFIDNDDNEKIFTTDDISLYTGRTNIFEIELVSGSTSEDLNNGKIFIDYNEKWRYYIYQSTTNDLTMNDVVNYTSDFPYIETGIVWIDNINSTLNKKTYSPTLNKKIYKP